MASLVGLVTSPDRQLELRLFVDSAGQLSYSVERLGSTVVEPSRLGISRSDVDLAVGLAFVSTSGPEQRDDRYRLVVGKRLSHEVVWIEQAFTFSTSSGSVVEIVVRAYDDGVAFRYCFPDEHHNPDERALRTVVAESTTFCVPDSVCWLQPQDAPGRTEPAYEANFTNGVAVNDLTAAHGWTMPALFNRAGQWIVIAEAGVDEQYCGSRLGGVSNGEFSIAFPHEDEGNGIGEAAPSSTVPWATAWRVIITSDDLATVAESCLVTHLSPPSRIDDVDWIRPGRVAWSWWSDNASPRDPDKLRHFVDFAADMGWEHHLVDANWNQVDQQAIRDLIDYASLRNVGTFLWYNSGGPNNIVGEQPRDRMTDRSVRRAEFAEIASWGVAGVKIDFFHSDKQERIRAYREILEDAAEARLMVNFHGCTAPRGWEREWPNLMTMEGVRGAEQYQAQPEYPHEAPSLLTILPFTRNLVGSMDYTPVTFTANRFPHITTSGFELALAVLVESGLQHFADSPESYRGLSPDALALLRDVPTVWDDTVVLAAYPGRYCALARRRNDVWWVAAINGTAESCELALDLDRLDLADGAVLTLVSDSNPATHDGTGLVTTSIAASSWSSSSSSSIELLLPPAGGMLARV